MAGSPTSSVVTTDPADGTVTGLVRVTDPDGDMLTYALDPASTAAVVVDPPPVGGCTRRPRSNEAPPTTEQVLPQRLSRSWPATGVQTPVAVSAPISPYRGTTIVLPTEQSHRVRW